MNEITLCMGSSCFSRGNNKHLQLIKEYLKKNDLEQHTEFKGKLCAGQCSKGPVIIVNGTLYECIDEMSLLKILNDNMAHPDDNN